MTEKTLENKNPIVASEETNTPQFEDFLKPNPQLKPWMEPYLPRNFYLRDLIIVAGWVTLSLIFAWICFVLLGDNGIYPAFPIVLIIIVHIGGGWWGRYMSASIKYSLKKKMRSSTDK
jgi:hypothetical protein